MSGRLSLGSKLPPRKQEPNLFWNMQSLAFYTTGLLFCLSLAAVSESEGSTVSRLKARLQGWGRSRYPAAGLSGVRTGPESTTFSSSWNTVLPAARLLSSTFPQPFIYQESPNSGCKLSAPKALPDNPQQRQSLLN